MNSILIAAGDTSVILIIGTLAAFYIFQVDVFWTKVAVRVRVHVYVYPGCGRTRTLINLGVLCIMWSFQDYLLPLMFTTSTSLTTATIAISSFKSNFGFNPVDQGRFYAALVLLGLPALLIFLFAQRYI